MATLTETSIISRKIIRYTVYVLVILTLGNFLVKSLITIYRILFPPPPAPPTVKFGKLPTLPFPEGKPNPKEYTYSLETASGGFPTFPDQLPVYFMPSPASNLSGLDNANAIARTLGFDMQGKIVIESVPNVYEYSRSDNQNTHFTINIVTNVWSVSYDLRADTSVIGGIPPEPTAAIEASRKYRSLPGISTPDLNGPIKTEFLKLEGGDLVNALSLSEADFTKINFFRKNFGDKGQYLSVTPDFPKEANVWFLYGKDPSKVVRGEFHYFPIDEQTSSTYPLINAQTAWENLTQGKAYISNYDTLDNKNITIRKVSLAYYDPGQNTQFYQPVIVFEGDDNFTAYVPAVTSEYYGEN